MKSMQYNPTTQNLVSEFNKEKYTNSHGNIISNGGSSNDNDNNSNFSNSSSPRQHSNVPDEYDSDIHDNYSDNEISVTSTTKPITTTLPPFNHVHIHHVHDNHHNNLNNNRHHLNGNGSCGFESGKSLSPTKHLLGDKQGLVYNTSSCKDYIDNLENLLQLSNKQNKELYEKIINLGSMLNEKKTLLSKYRNVLIDYLEEVHVNNDSDCENNGNGNYNGGRSNDLDFIGQDLKSNKYYPNINNNNNNNNSNNNVVSNGNYNGNSNNGGSFHHFQIYPPPQNSNNNNSNNNNNNKRKSNSDDDGDSLDTRDSKKGKPGRTVWSQEEEDIYKEVFNNYGKNWKKIKTHFPDKSKSQVTSHGQYLIKIGKLEDLAKVKSPKPLITNLVSIHSSNGNGNNSGNNNNNNNNNGNHNNNNNNSSDYENDDQDNLIIDENINNNN